MKESGDQIPAKAAEAITREQRRHEPALTKGLMAYWGAHPEAEVLEYTSYWFRRLLDPAASPPESGSTAAFFQCWVDFGFHCFTSTTAILLGLPGFQDLVRAMLTAVEIVDSLMFESGGVFESVLRETVVSAFPAPDQAAAFFGGYGLYFFDVQNAVMNALRLSIHALGEAHSFRALIDLYIAEVKAKTGKTITLDDIAESAGYKDDTEVKRVAGNSKKATRAARATLLRVLVSDKPHLQPGYQWREHAKHRIEK